MPKSTVKPSDTLEQIKRACKVYNVPEPIEQMVAHSAGLSVTTDYSEVYQLARVVERDHMDRLPKAAKILIDIILYSGLYELQPITEEQAVRASRELAKFTNAQLKAVEVTAGNLSEVGGTAHLNREDMAIVKEFFDREYGPVLDFKEPQGEQDG